MAAISKTLCNMCGKEFDEFDAQEDFNIHTSEIGWGSRYDGDRVDLDLCCDCFDNLMKEILPKCKINPLARVN